VPSHPRLRQRLIEKGIESLEVGARHFHARHLQGRFHMDLRAGTLVVAIQTEESRAQVQFGPRNVAHVIGDEALDRRERLTVPRVSPGAPRLDGRGAHPAATPVTKTTMAAASVRLTACGPHARPHGPFNLVSIRLVSLSPGRI